jgi:hypothetical protein
MCRINSRVITTVFLLKLTDISFDIAMPSKSKKNKKAALPPPQVTNPSLKPAPDPNIKMTSLPPRVAQPSLKPDPDPNIGSEDFTEEDLEAARMRLQNIDNLHVSPLEQWPPRHTIVSPGLLT